MATSQNGYSANDRSVIARYTVPGTTLKIALRKGDVSVVLLDFLAWYHREIESLYHNPQDLWGYAERVIRGSSTTLSNHASGTAADHRAVKHPLGKRGTFTAEQMRKIRERLRFYEGVLRHGIDYVSRPDEMHVEINKGVAEVRRIADKIRAQATGAAPPTEPGPARRKVQNDVLDNETIPPGKTERRLILPTGSASAMTARSFLSFVSNGPRGGTVRGWWQNDQGGIANGEFRLTIGFRDGHSQRPPVEAPSGTTQVNLHLDFPDGGTMCIETMAK